MAYTSDFRIKNLLKDIHNLIVSELRREGFSDAPTLRVFVESSEDNILFKKGGLTFTDPDNNYEYGSNDAAWVYQGRPLVVVEGTFGTERGQFGDGQLNRFSHSFGVARNGYTGVTFVPFKGESYSKTGKVIEGLNSSIRLKHASIHKGFLKGAINVNTTEKGNFYAIDTYSPLILKELVIETFKEVLGVKNNLAGLKVSILKRMEEEISGYIYGARSKGIIKSLYGESGKIISKFSRAYTQNFLALTDSSKRDGHGLFGKCLVESYLSGKEKYFAIFLRLSDSDKKRLSKRRGKEFSFINNSSQINVATLDDLNFSNKQLRENLEKIKNINLFQNRQNDLLREVQKSINEGETRLEGH